MPALRPAGKERENLGGLGRGDEGLAGRDCFGGRLPVIPGHPALGIPAQFARVPFEFGHVIERVGPAELARVDQAHEDVADVGAILGLVEQGILAV